MEELAILRGQVGTERRHLAAVRAACRAARPSGRKLDGAGPFFTAARDYLLYITDRLHSQDLAHARLLRPRVAAGSEAAALLDDLEATLGELQTARQALGDSRDPVNGVSAFLDFLEGVLGRRRHSLEPLFTEHYTIDDWRAASAVDADSILEERERFAAVRAALPPGVAFDTGS